VHQAYSRASELARQLGTPSQLFAALLGLRRFYLHRGELQTAHDLGAQLRCLAEDLDDPGARMRAHQMCAESFLFLGEFAHARAQAEQGIALSEPQQHHSQVLRYGSDAEVQCRFFGAEALWVLGYTDQALQRSTEALALAQERKHPFSLAFALRHMACIHQLRREPCKAYEWAEARLPWGPSRGLRPG
jgi:tetratricopeptide (TPR) repeat protein